MNIEFTKFQKNENWVAGTVDGGDYRFESKLFDVGSDFGIDEGRVSKLWIQSGKGNCVVNYDRGWDVEPTKGKVEEVYLAVLKFLEDAPTTRFK